MSNIYLELKNISKVYKNFSMRNVNVCFEGGKCYYLKGKNGSGKTTLLNLIANFIFPDTGYILYWGKKLKGNEKWIKNRMAFIPNYVALPTHITPQFLGTMYKEMYERFDMDTFMNHMNRFHVNNMNQKLEEMSDGMKKKVLIALELSYFPEIVIADELCNNLDEEAIQYCFEQLNNLCKKKNSLVIISSHEAQEILGGISEIFTIENGIIREGKK